VARPALTGILLLGGSSSRFGSPKALAELEGETLAERAWRTLGEACEHRLAVGKQADGLELPFPVLDDGSELRASIVGLAAGLRAAPSELCVVLPVDCPRMTASALLMLADACAEAAMPPDGPLPGAYRKSVLGSLEGPERSIRRALEGREVAIVALDPALLVNVNRPSELEALRSAGRREPDRC